MEAFCHAAPLNGGLSTTGQEGNGSAQGGELLTDRDLAPMLKPSRRWRNEWKTLRTVLTSAGIVPPGITLVSNETWPSYEMAEQAAIEATQMGVADGLSIYLGPVADSE